jgi:hypothetical protein
MEHSHIPIVLCVIDISSTQLGDSKNSKKQDGAQTEHKECYENAEPSAEALSFDDRLLPRISRDTPIKDKS